MTLLHSDYCHLDATDAHVYIAVRDHGPLNFADVLGKFNDLPLSLTVHSINRLVQAGILVESRIDDVRTFQVAPAMDAVAGAGDVGAISATIES